MGVVWGPKGAQWGLEPLIWASWSKKLTCYRPECCRPENFVDSVLNYCIRLDLLRYDGKHTWHADKCDNLCFRSELCGDCHYDLTVVRLRSLRSQ